jgi:hypothetical protein
MKFSDITGQDLTTLTEAPMGFMNTLKTGAKALLNPSLSGRKQAQGQFKTGMSANQIYGEFYKWLGQSNAPSNTNSVISFLQQQGYGQQAIAAAQKAFPAPEAPAASTATSQPNFGSGQTQAPAPSKVNYTGMPQKKPLPRATNATNGAFNVKSPYATQPAAQPTTTTASTPADQNLDPRAAGAKSRAKLAAQRPRLKEDAAIELDKDQLSAIFTAVARSGATPQATTSDNASNTAQSSATNQSQSQSSNTSNQQAARGLPARLNPDQILNYYANLTSTYEREQVKKGIAEIDKQLSQQTQQTKQQPAK